MKKLLIIVVVCISFAFLFAACSGGKKCPAYESVKIENPFKV